MKILVKEVRMLNPQFQAGHIRGMYSKNGGYHIIMVHVYYSCSVHILPYIVTRQKCGKDVAMKASRRRRERLLRVSLGSANCVAKNADSKPHAGNNYVRACPIQCIKWPNTRS